jgi:FKBP-type peptidyl-prolyl cis-trans isomerase (trigger factor)
MTDTEKSTIKIPAYPGRDIPRNNLTEEQDNALELVKRNAQLQEEKNKSLELQKMIEQLRESLKLEQAKTNEIAERAVQLEARVEELARQEGNNIKVAELEAKVTELTELLRKISGMASAGKPD